MAEEMRVLLPQENENLTDLQSYINAGGYKALEKARSTDRLSLIEEVKKSGLRGRGGAGFNAGMKWQFSYSVETEPKYVVCNADEGEPGTYKDRVLMQTVPHRILEGMAICGYAIGARQGYIYCRGEYPFVVETLNQAIKEAKDSGVLGDFDIEVRMGAGAYVCGEESALIESIEGHRGEPRFKPPFPPVKGLWGQPTIVNNVETLAYIPLIVEKGADWFKSIGAPSYPGTKLLTLTGDVVERKIIEVPTNVTIRQVIYDYGKGIRDGKKFKAVQIGGTSGGFIPEELLDTAIDFDSMSAIGATLGSGAVFVMDETRDIVDVVERITKFFEHESCGKCIPCREGTKRMHEMMERINHGKGSGDDLGKLERLGTVMSRACLCGLGQAAPAPVLTTLGHFREEYQAKLN
ncbi:MAG: NADH-quinone oxidoreductase subunit NuoF [Syntrophomonadaceae bacterium]|jgi:NADH:ubiquinone oxidoreductase subunit F (NADH-binding)|nr:NADH-quinone oxidoreductase subunit NuoF [Syntrophomonadaceae bacterium]